MNLGNITQQLYVVAMLVLQADTMYLRDKYNKFKCAEGIFKCRYRMSGAECIEGLFVCDGYKHCTHGEDESIATCKYEKCGPDYVKCKDRLLCIHQSRWCNGRIDCKDASDESECDTYKCLPNYFKCNVTRSCVPKVKGDLTKGFNCELGRACFGHWKRCNGEGECHEASDEKDCESYQCQGSYSKCHDNRKCVGFHGWCDGWADCEDESDENSPFCKNIKYNPNKKPCRNCKKLSPASGSSVQQTTSFLSLMTNGVIGAALWMVRI